MAARSGSLTGSDHSLQVASGRAELPVRVRNATPPDFAPVPAPPNASPARHRSRVVHRRFKPAARARIASEPEDLRQVAGRRQRSAGFGQQPRGIAFIGLRHQRGRRDPHPAGRSVPARRSETESRRDRSPGRKCFLPSSSTASRRCYRDESCRAPSGHRHSCRSAARTESSRRRVLAAVIWVASRLGRARLIRPADR